MFENCIFCVEVPESLRAINPESNSHYCRRENKTKACPHKGDASQCEYDSFIESQISSNL